MNMSIGWPNNTSGSGPVIYNIGLYNCNDSEPFIILYSASSEFAEEIYLYLDEALTDPYTGIGGAYTGANQYQIIDGLVTSEYSTCG
jgi:hypothetical protein